MLSSSDASREEPEPARCSRGGWRIDGSKFRILAGVLLGLFAAYWAVFVGLTLHRGSGQPSDFFGLWSVAKFAAAHPAAEVYDAPALRGYQLALGMDPRSDYPFPYPPYFLLMLRPLAALPYVWAYVLTLGSTLGLYVWATVGRHWRPALVAAAVFAPTSTLTLVAGQAGFLSAALLVGGYRLIGRWPLAAGVLFGLAAYKPQLALLVPVALIAARRWDTVAAAASTIVLLMIAASTVFGTDIWAAWLADLGGYSAEFTSASGKVGHLMPTIVQSLMAFGLPLRLAEAGQAVAGLLAAGVVWTCFRRGPSLLAATAALVGAFLATPHAFVYDMPPLTTAVLWMILERHRHGGALTTFEVLSMITAMISPVLLVAGSVGPPATVFALALLLAAIARACCSPVRPAH